MNNEKGTDIVSNPAVLAIIKKYATAFAIVGKTLTDEQRSKLMGIRNLDDYHVTSIITLYFNGISSTKARIAATARTDNVVARILVSRCYNIIFI